MLQYILVKSYVLALLGLICKVFDSVKLVTKIISCEI